MTGAFAFQPEIVLQEPAQRGVQGPDQLVRDGGSPLAVLRGTPGSAPVPLPGPDPVSAPPSGSVTGSGSGGGGSSTASATSESRWTTGRDVPETGAPPKTTLPSAIRCATPAATATAPADGNRPALPEPGRERATEAGTGGPPAARR